MHPRFFSGRKAEFFAQLVPEQLRDTRAKHARDTDRVERYFDASLRCSAAATGSVSCQSRSAKRAASSSRSCFYKICRGRPLCKHRDSPKDSASVTVSAAATSSYAMGALQPGGGACDTGCCETSGELQEPTYTDVPWGLDMRVVRRSLAQCAELVADKTESSLERTALRRTPPPSPVWMWLLRAVHVDPAPEHGSPGDAAREGERAERPARGQPEGGDVRPRLDRPAWCFD